MINESQAEQQYNLRKLLGEYTIEIPPIQRDYAQGRVDDTRVTAIREQFVSTLLDTLREGKSLRLDFIYGKSFNKALRLDQQKKEEALESLLQPIKKYSEGIDYTLTYTIAANANTKNDGEKILILLDGQQRVTTLFLLYWWVGAIAKKDLALLKKFSYKTRSSSTDFCAKLIENANMVIADEKNYNSIKENIVDQSWFADSWLADPTVQGMLVMLCEIEKQAKSKALDYENAWANLDKITFDFFDMKEHGLSDELYVKMNARGKHLSDFENFKAWLLKHIAKNKKEYSIANENWETKLDKDWLDLFWGLTTEEKSLEEHIKVMDGYYLFFFKQMALYSFITKSGAITHSDKKSEKENVEQKEQQEKKEEEVFIQLNNKEFVPTTFYEEHQLFNAFSIGQAFKLLDFFSNKEKSESLKKIVDLHWKSPFLDSEGGNNFKDRFLKGDLLTQTKQVFAFSIINLILEKGEELESNDFKASRWMRVQRNLIYNQTIQSKENVFEAIQQINEFDYEKLSIDRLLFATQKQREEEKKKLELLDKDDNWLEAIEKAENHFYLYGQVGFLLDLARDDEGNPQLESFKKYYAQVVSLLELMKDEVLLHQFLLTKEIMTDNEDQQANLISKVKINHGGHKVVLLYKNDTANVRVRRENWRILFAQVRCKTLLDNLLLGKYTTNEDYKNEIREWLENVENKKKWQYGLVEFPSLRSDYSTAIYWRKNVEKVKYYDTRLMSTKTLGGKNTDLHLYLLFMKLKSLIPQELKLMPISNNRNDENKYSYIAVGKELMWISYALSDHANTAQFRIEYPQKYCEVFEECSGEDDYSKSISKMYDYIEDAVRRIQEIIENPPND